jgi:hypothetical protein
MPLRHAAALPRLIAATTMALLGYGAVWLNVAAAEPVPAAPTIADAHQFFAALVDGNDVITIHESINKDGDILGYRTFPAQQYRGAACRSRITLQNGVNIDLDWTAVERTQARDGSLSILHGQDLQFTFFHMLTLEGGIVVEPANAIARLIFAIVDEVPRNRLLKAIDLVTDACRAKSKFD